MGSASARVARLWIVAGRELCVHNILGMAPVCAGRLGDKAGRRLDSKRYRRKLVNRQNNSGVTWE
jgi:hypothetical protein